MTNRKPPRGVVLGRQSAGLDRFWMDCGWWTHPSWLDAPVEVLAVFMAIASYGNQHGTDGKLPSRLPSLSLALSLPEECVCHAVEWLTEHDKIRRDGEWFVVTSWAEHNPTSAEIKAHTAARSKSGSWGAHVRWHTGEGGKPAPDSCGHCQADSTRHANRIAKTWHGMEWNGTVTSPPTDLRCSDGQSVESDHGSEVWLRRLVATVGDDVGLTDEQVIVELRMLHAENPERSGADLVAALRAGEHVL